MQARRYQQDVAALEQVFEYIMQSLANYRLGIRFLCMMLLSTVPAVERQKSRVFYPVQGDGICP